MAHTVFETDGAIATLTFNRPEARNAMTWEMYDALVAACEQVDRDPAIRVLICRGAGGKAFVAGTDITQFQNFNNRDDGLKYEERLDHVLDRLERVTKPTIAQVEGVAAGGGCAIALTCDLRVATPDAAFGIPIARTLGNCLSMSNLARLNALVGPARAKEMIFTARLVEADEAASLGLLNEIVPDTETLQRRADELAHLVASHAPITLETTKEALRRMRRTLSRDEGQDLILRAYMSEDFREGMDAFLSKRKPVFKGR